MGVGNLLVREETYVLGSIVAERLLTQNDRERLGREDQRPFILRGVYVLETYVNGIKRKESFGFRFPDSPEIVFSYDANSIPENSCSPNPIYTEIWKLTYNDDSVHRRTASLHDYSFDPDVLKTWDSEIIKRVRHLPPHIRDVICFDEVFPDEKGPEGATNSGNDGM